MPLTRPRPLGRRGGVAFHAARIDAINSAVDLLVVGMAEQIDGGRPGGGAAALDRAWHGTLRRLRQGGIFRGGWGETLTLIAPPAPLRAGALMLIGLGPTPQVHGDGRLRNAETGRFTAGPADTGGIGDLTALAMDAALRMAARNTACLLGWCGSAPPLSWAVPAAEAMMHGALAALGRHGAPGHAMDWTFDIRGRHATAVAAALSAPLAEPDTDLRSPDD